jgi:hypothetical protein
MRRHDCKRSTQLHSSAQVCLLLATLLFLLLGLAYLSHAAVADGYTYERVDVPFAGAHNTRITGLTERGTLAGTYTDAAGVERSWRKVRGKGFEKLGWLGKRLEVSDIAGNTRVVGRYQDATGWHAFTMRSGKLRELRVPGMGVGSCAINQDGTDIACLASAARQEGEVEVYDEFVVYFTPGGAVVGSVPLPFWPSRYHVVTGVNG